jgi:hypothetical protein
MFRCMCITCWCAVIFSRHWRAYITDTWMLVIFCTRTFYILCSSSYTVLYCTVQPFLLLSALYPIERWLWWGSWTIYEQIWFCHCVCFFWAVIVAVRINFPMWISFDVYSGLVRLSSDVTFQLVQRDYGHSLIQFPQASCTPQFIMILHCLSALFGMWRACTMSYSL